MYLEEDIEEPPPLITPMALLSVPVPVEIIDTIIDELHDDTDTLRNCALVARAFCPCAQKHLYMAIAIRFSDHPSPKHEAQGLLDVLTSRPRLARNVRHFRVLNYMEGFWDPDVESWTQIQDEVLVRIFQQLSSLRSFAFRASEEVTRSYCRPPEVNWSHLSPSLILALCTLLKSSRIAELNIHGFTNIPISDIVLRCTALKKLSLSHTDSLKSSDEMILTSFHGPELPEEPDEAVQEKHQLEILDLGCNSDLTAYSLYQQAVLPHSVINLSCLREIICDINTLEHFPHRLMWHCNDVLEIVVLDCADFCSMIEDGESPWFLTLWAYVRILRASFDHPHGSTPHHMVWLCETLERNSRQEHDSLEEIVLVLNTDVTYDVDHVWCESLGWTAWLDILLTGPVEFPYFKKLTIFVQHPALCEHRACLPVARFTEVNRLLERMLRLLHAKGMLSVRWMVIEEGVNTWAAVTRALDQGIEGGIFVGPDGRLGRGLPLL